MIRVMLRNGESRRGVASDPPPLVAPTPNEVHVWWIALERMGDDALVVLSSKERSRADRFRRSADRERWRRARAALRHILAAYTGTPPAELRFVHPPSTGSTGEGNRGKPALAGNSPLRFSLTHAGDRAALAVAWEREVGIDLEPIEPGLDLPPLLGATCTPLEIARLETLPLVQRVRAFLVLWTLKEAYLKATGVGLSRDPRAVEVEVLPGHRATVHDPGQSNHPEWRLRLLDAGPGWVAALASAGAEPAFDVFAWPPRERPARG